MSKVDSLWREYNAIPKIKSRRVTLVKLTGPEHQAWSNIKAICFNQKCKDYCNYGARGITMCESWRNSYAEFFKSVGGRPTEKHTIERHNNNGNYEPGNCYWADRVTQNNNKRNSLIINYDGESKTLSQWSKELKISYMAAHRAIERHKKDVGIDQAFIDHIAPKSKLPAYKKNKVLVLKIKKRQGPPKYYHDLSDVIKKYRLHPLGFRYNSNIINSK